jgi:hypothetical protein
MLSVARPPPLLGAARGAPTAPRRRRAAAAAATAAAAAAAATSATSHLSAPLVSEVAEVLTPTEPVPTPLWGSFANGVAGVWVGTAAAFSPATGAPEGIALSTTGRGRPALEAWQCCVEARAVDGAGGDRLVRRTARAATFDALAEEMRCGGALRFGGEGGAEGAADGSSAAAADGPAPCALIDWEEEALAPEEPGTYCFDGGSYSRGPAALGTGAAAAGAAAVLELELEAAEQTSGAPSGGEEEEESDGEEGAETRLGGGSSSEGEDAAAGAWSDDEDGEDAGERRVRVRLTLAAAGGGAAGGELDVDLLRVAVAAEGWEGQAGGYLSAPAAAAARAAAVAAAGAAARRSPAAAAGFWSSFEIAACTVDDVDACTGERARVPVYTSQVVQRLYSDAAGAAGGAGGRAAVEGGALWLPHGVAVQLELAPPPGGAPGGNKKARRELTVTVMWWPPAAAGEPATLLSQTRRYSAAGELLEVVAASAVRAK